jgi:ubiquinone/menaquinone biosynthesis C-methylase UbiE
MITQELSEVSEAWDNIAVGYDRYVTPTDNWALPKHALKLAGLQPGMHFLDVASGSGALSLPAARLGADVTATDISPGMIERLTERAREEGLGNIQCRVMNGHALEFDDDTFDIAGSQFGVMLFPDMPRAVRELVRVTKPGGRVFLVVFAHPTKVEFLGTFIGAIQSVVPGFTGLPMDPLPLPFQASDTKVLRRRMEEAGLRDVRIEPGVERLPFRSGNEMWEWVTNSNPIAVQLISGLTDDQKIEVQAILDDMLQERAKIKAVAVLEAGVYIGIGAKR